MAMADNTLGIGEVAKRAGLRPSAIRFYEQVGVLPAPRRVRGQRRYDESLVRRLELARFAQSVGFSLAEIKRLLGLPGERALSSGWRRLAEAKVAELDRIMDAATQMKWMLESGLRCGCLRAQDCASRQGPARG